jgi:membrane protein implicated in regulation of membrane protease activity
VTLAALLSGTSRATASLLGICAGLVLVFISLYLMRAFLKLQESGTLEMEDLAGKRAVVYIAVGGGASGAGKVMVDTTSGRVELPARTDDLEAIRPGRMAKILRAEGGVLWITAKNE